MTFLSIASSRVRYSLMETGSLWPFSLKKNSISTLSQDNTFYGHQAFIRRDESSQPLARLLLEADRGDDLAPLCLLGGEERGVVLRRARRRNPAHPGELLNDRWRAQRRHRGSVDALADVCGRGGGGEEAVPVVGRDVGIAHLGRGRHLGQRLRTLRARDGERLQLAGADVAQQHRHVEDAHLYLPAQEIAYRRRGAFVRHVHQVDLRLGLEQLAGEMRAAAA